MIGLGAELEQTTCSRAGCREEAAWRLDWRNPRIHAEDRVKTWLACPEHLDYLREFLAARDFPLAVAPFPVPAAAAPASAASDAESRPSRPESPVHGRFSAQTETLANGGVARSEAGTA